MLNALQAVGRWLGLLAGTLAGLAKVALVARPRRLPPATQPVAMLLGNAPSLPAHLQALAPLLPKAELYVVNSFAQSGLYAELKPQNYVLHDPRYWRFPDDADVRKLFDDFREKTTWPVRFFLPQFFKGSVLVRDYLHKMPNVQIVYFNYVKFRGLRELRHRLYRRGLAMPQCRQVLQAASILALNRGAAETYILGLENSLHHDFVVGPDNTVWQYYDHFYTGQPGVVVDPSGPRKHDLQYAYAQEARGGQQVTRWQTNKTLLSQLQMTVDILAGYYAVADYAKWLGRPVYNASPTSQVDCFPRKCRPA